MRVRRVAAIGVVAAMALAACGNDNKDKTSAGAGGGGAKCSGIALGFFGALTGDSANLGINERNGAKLAVNEFNAKNPNCQVGFKEFDSQGSPDQAPQLAAKAVQDTALVGLVGPAFSGESKVADPIFNEAVLPVITPSATNPTLANAGLPLTQKATPWKIFHRAVGNDNAQGPAAAKYMTDKLGAKKIAVIDDASEYGKGIADIVRQKLGSTAVVSDTLDPKATDFSSTVNKVKPKAPDAVFFGGYYEAGGRLAKQLKDAGVKGTFVGPDGVNDKGFVTAAGAAASEGAILLAPAAPIEKVEGGADFQQRYKKAFNVDTGLYSVEAFDAANAYLDAISHGAVKRADINDYLNSKLDFKGLSKTLKFDDKGELSGGVTVYAYKVQTGTIVGLEPITA